MFTYPGSLEPDDNNTILATFPDVPEAVTFGDDAADGQKSPVGALIAIFSAYLDDRQRIPCHLHSRGRTWRASFPWEFRQRISCGTSC